jgi:hypothetical protein
METQVTEIADRVYRLSTFVPGIAHRRSRSSSS